MEIAKGEWRSVGTTCAPSSLPWIVVVEARRPPEGVIRTMVNPQRRIEGRLRRFTLAAVAGLVVVVVAFLLSSCDKPGGTTTSAIAEQGPRTSESASTADVPELTQPVNDFANVIGGGRNDIERVIRTLFSETADVIVVATIRSIAPFSDIRDYSVEMFNRNGIGASGKDNGILVLLAVDDRRVRITTGFGMEPIIPDAVATQIARRMTDHFRRGEIDAGLLAGVEELAHRIRTVRTKDR